MTGKCVQQVTILGATGSIGRNTLSVIAAHPDHYQVYALTAHSNEDLLFDQCCQFKPVVAVMTDAKHADSLRQRLAAADVKTQVLSGNDALQLAASDSSVDIVMAAIMGGAGLLPTLAAAKAGKKVLLANKEALVMSGPLFMDAARQHGAIVIPIDSEHNAIFQCLPVNESAGFERNTGDGFSKIVLTASGGPFLHHATDLLETVTPDQACAHPNWSMGRKISVDSATLINKALELIEASYLFEVAAEQIDILIHPQSIVHSMVHFCDGSVLAQLGNPDMKTPIAYGLAWPKRINAGVSQLDLAALSDLEFFPADYQKFPGLQLGREVAVAKGSAPLVFNAANEIAVQAFLNKHISFTQIPVIIDKVLQQTEISQLTDLEQVLALDEQIRQLARNFLRQAA